MEIKNKREEIVKKLKKIIKNSDVFYETFFDGVLYTTSFHISTDKFSVYFTLDDEIMLNNKTSITVQQVIKLYEYNIHCEVFNTKEYNKLYERMIK